MSDSNHLLTSMISTILLSEKKKVKKISENEIERRKQAKQCFTKTGH